MLIHEGIRWLINNPVVNQMKTDCHVCLKLCFTTVMPKEWPVSRVKGKHTTGAKGAFMTHIYRDSKLPCYKESKKLRNKKP